jgi:hypothetical protein
MKKRSVRNFNTCLFIPSLNQWVRQWKERVPLSQSKLNICHATAFPWYNSTIYTPSNHGDRCATSVNSVRIWTEYHKRKTESSLAEWSWISWLTQARHFSWTFTSHSSQCSLPVSNGNIISSLYYNKNSSLKLYWIIFLNRELYLNVPFAW